MRRGQVALYLVFVLLALSALAIMNVRTFVAVRQRSRTEAAGDAAALAAARVQGRLLNEIGRLNLEHLKAALAGDVAKSEEIVTEQKRLAFLGPIEALVAANDFALRNRADIDESFTVILRDHVRTVREVYSRGVNEAGEPYPEPWPGAWLEYAARLESAISGGLAVGPDNCEFLPPAGGHTLLDPCFYDAIAGRCWCWFGSHAKGLLTSYGNYRYWPPLPTRTRTSTDNAEIFPLHVRAVRTSLVEAIGEEAVREILAKSGDDILVPATFLAGDLVCDDEETWFFFEPDVYRRWIEISPFSEPDHVPFPVVGAVKPEYDVLGCAAVCRVRSGSSEWSAAAKPFGRLALADGFGTVAAHSFLVLPAFETARLIPIDTALGGGLGSANAQWVWHVRHHLQGYLRTGPLVRDCFYCRQLLVWEQAAFRKTGADWLKFHAKDCVRPASGHGGGRGGGAAHGH